MSLKQELCLRWITIDVFMQSNLRQWLSMKSTIRFMLSHRILMNRRWHAVRVIDWRCILFRAGFFSTLGLIFGGVEESKIRNNQLFNMTILSAFFSVLLYFLFDCGVSLENTSIVKWIIFWFFFQVVFIKIQRYDGI